MSGWDSGSPLRSFNIKRIEADHFKSPTASSVPARLIRPPSSAPRVTACGLPLPALLYDFPPNLPIPTAPRAKREWNADAELSF